MLLISLPLFGAEGSSHGEMTARLLTLKGPGGKYMTVRAKDPKRMEKLHLGDTIVATFHGALAVAVEKAK